MSNKASFNTPCGLAACLGIMTLGAACVQTAGPEAPNEIAQPLIVRVAEDQLRADASATSANDVDAGQAALCSGRFAACVLLAPTESGVSECLARFSDCDALFGDGIDGGAQSVCALDFCACVLASPVASGLCLGAFQRCAGVPADPKPPATCGDGVVAPTEECDPAAPGWGDYCSPTCERTVYRACSAHEDCSEPVANCAAFTNEPQNQVCAAFCEDASGCPVLPGFDSACDFAWCAVTCRSGVCPNEMRCEPDFPLLDKQGQSVGTVDVCVAAPEAKSP